MDPMVRVPDLLNAIITVAFSWWVSFFLFFVFEEFLKFQVAFLITAQTILLPITGGPQQGERHCKDLMRRLTQLVSLWSGNH